MFVSVRKRRRESVLCVGVGVLVPGELKQHWYWV